MLIDTEGRPERCFECGGAAEHRHHVIPRSKGGTKTVPLCQGCHGLVHFRVDDTGSLLRHAYLRAHVAAARAAEPADASVPSPPAVDEPDVEITASDIKRSKVESDHPPEFYAALRAKVRARR